MKALSWQLLVLLNLVACGTQAAEPIAKKTPKDPYENQDLNGQPQGSQNNPNNGPNQPNPNTPGPPPIDPHAMTHPDLHYFLIHGGGPSLFVQMNGLKNGMAQAGISEDRVHLISYNHGQSLNEVSQDVGNQMRTKFSTLPSTVRVDVIAHSLGDFVGLYSVVNNQLEDRVRKYIALAGIKNGQEKKPITCLFGCSDIYDMITPYQNPQLNQFYSQHQNALEKMNHCAIDSQNDSMVNNPRQSGAYTNGKKVMISGLSHLDFRSAKAFPHIRTHCYGQ